MCAIKYFLALILFTAAFPAFAQTAAKKESGSFTVQDKRELRKSELAALDANNDGKVSVAELMGSIHTKFFKIDKDNNGVADLAEQAAYFREFRTAHENVYGKSIDNQVRKLQQRFALIDVNKDGKITFNEYSTYFSERYLRFDRNGDSIISDDEYFTDVDKYPYAN